MSPSMTGSIPALHKELCLPEQTAPHQQPGLQRGQHVGAEAGAQRRVERQRPRADPAPQLLALRDGRGRAARSDVNTPTVKKLKWRQRGSSCGCVFTPTCIRMWLLLVSLLLGSQTLTAVWCACAALDLHEKHGKGPINIQGAHHNSLVQAPQDWHGPAGHGTGLACAHGLSEGAA